MNIFTTSFLFCSVFFTISTSDLAYDVVRYGSLEELLQAFRQSTKYFIEELYSNRSGFDISAQESAIITTAGGQPTYGEITYDALAMLLKDIQPTKDDVFYDLGSGIGKAIVQVLLTTPIQKAVGIELSETRHAQAQNIKNELLENGVLKDKHLEFRHENFIQSNMFDATIIYTCSTCFSNQLMSAITVQLAKLKPGLRVLTMRPLMAHMGFVLIKCYALPMSWTNCATVYLYKLI